MKQIKAIILLLLFTAVAGCSGLSLKPLPHTDEAEVKNSNDKLLPKEVITSSTNSCVDDITLLRQTRYNDYKILVQQYEELMNEYHFLRKNSEIMDKDTKRYLSDILTMKRETLCSKIKFNAFQSIKEKMASLASV